MLIDGHDLRDVTHASLRDQLAVVPQEGFLFAGTVRENMAFGRPEATDEEVRAAADAVGADAFIEALPDGLRHARAGARRAGCRPASASWSRSPARSLADPRLLILDEATSSVDLATEGRIERPSRPLLAGPHGDRHRPPPLHDRRADRIVVLEDGRIVEQGTHDELVDARRPLRGRCTATGWRPPADEPRGMLGGACGRAASA